MAISNDKTFVIIGASSHSNEERQPYDFYATPPYATELLLQNETFKGEIWEPACGLGHIAEPLKKAGYTVKASDLVNREYEHETLDFLLYNKQYNGNIITNPPYSMAKEFIKHSLSIIPNGYKVAMFLKLTFLEGKARKLMFREQPFKTLYVSSSRITCCMNADFEKYKSSAVAYGWYVWEKGFNGDPIIKWIN